MSKQTPYRYSIDAKDSIRNVHSFSKQEREDGLKIPLNRAAIEKPEQKERTMRVELVRRAYFVSRACIQVKGDDHEPVIIYNASDSDCNYDTETARKTEGM